MSESLKRCFPIYSAASTAGVAALALVLAFNIYGSHSPTIENPYATQKAKWIKVNLHVHTTRTGGSMDPCQAAQAYAAAGYGAIVLSDKTEATGSGPVTADPGPACDTSGTNTVTIIPGYEDTQADATGSHHLTIANVNSVDIAASNVSRQSAINYAIQHPASPDGVFIAFAHPNFNLAGWSNLMMESLTGVNALEVWNGQGFDSTANLDTVLGDRDRLWVDAADDSYFPSAVDSTWNVVNANSNSRADVMEALRSGRYYITERYGHALRCGVAGANIVCSSYLDESGTIPFVGTYKWLGGKGDLLRQTQNVGSDSYAVKGNERYVRVVVSNQYGYYRAASQPFFIAP